MMLFAKVFSTLVLAVVFFSCSSWALSATTCSSQLTELATQLDEAFSRVFDYVAEKVLAGTGSTTPPVASNPPSSGPTPSTSPAPPYEPVRLVVTGVGYSIPVFASDRRRRSRGTAGRLRTLRSLYQNLTRARGEAPSDTIYDQFVSAMSDISQEHFKACYGPSNEGVRPAHLRSLIRQFNGLRNTSLLHDLRAVFAKLLCIRNQNSKVGKRSTTDSLEEFFRCLSDKDFGDVFGFTETNAWVNDSSPTGSLAFAVDTTGSMRDEIQDVRRIIRAFLRSENREPFYYVLAEFNDYGNDSGQCDLEKGGKTATAYNSRISTEVINLVTAIDNLQANGGGDCHEYGMAGILKSLHTHIHPIFPVLALGKGSHIIVLTDAGSKDRIECKNQAIAEARKRGIHIHFFLSSTGCLDIHAADAYKEVASETEGVVVETAVDFEALAMFVQKLAESAPNGPSSGRRKRSILQTTEQRYHSIKVSAFTTSLDLLFNTTNTQITVQTPDGHVTGLNKSNSDKLKFFSEKEPKPGTWNASVPSGTLSVSTILHTDVKFIVSFLQEGTDAAGNRKYYLATVEPNECSTGTVVVRVLEGQMDLISSLHPLYLDFLDAAKNILKEIPVSACNGLFRGTATFPASMDFLQLRGTDIFGIPFSYVRPAINAPFKFRPSRFSLMPTSGTVSIATGSTQTLTYQLQAVETEGNTSFSFSLQAGSGFVATVSTAQAVISGKQSLTVSVRVTPTSFVAKGNHQITLTATSGCNTLQASQTVTVNPQITSPVSDQCGGCQNGGTCYSLPWGARVVSRCGCTPEYAGTHCEIAM